MTSKEVVCAVCRRTFTIEYPEYMSPDEDPAFVHGIGLKLNHGPGRFLGAVLACPHCTGELLAQFSAGDDHESAFVAFIRSLVTGKPVKEESAEVPEDVPSDGPASEETEVEETAEVDYDGDVVTQEMLDELSKGRQSIEVGNILTEEMLRDLEDPTRGLLGSRTIDDLKEGEVVTAEMLAQLEEGR